MKTEILDLFNVRIYTVCQALVTADDREDVARAMSDFYSLLDAVYIQGIKDSITTATTATQTATA